ncbi:MAG: branched-chain amino acid ABC transporter substrate-binding protein [Dactylosporangium sp.]|nr:branched-chain amino acid ABC transporter substrate-binding protein [Dactylosporangium sp.]NNJ59817.1 branched-chain amino acid ABC transporter substrate-binding protein [Dactylosporangium sp.]
MRRGPVRVAGGLILAAALAAAAAGCNSASSTDSSGTSDKCGLKIAFFGALTGSAANLGVNIEQGAELAIIKYNEEHADCKVEVAKFDSQGTPDNAPALARQLVTDDKVIGVVGPAFSGESVAANPIFEEAGIPLITPSATRPSLSTEKWKVFHRAVANDDAQGPAAALYIKDGLKSQKVFIVDDQTAYGAGLADTVKATLGSLVVGTDKVQADGQQTDFSATVTKIVSSGAESLFYGGYYQNAGLIRKQLTAAGWTGTMVSGDGVKDPGFLTSAGKEAAEGSVMTCPCAPATEAKGSFAADYKAQWNIDPGTYSDVAYDAAGIFLKGIDEGNTTPEKMNEFLGEVTFEGIANTYSFTETGELDPSKLIVWTFKVSSGDIVPDVKAPTS